MKTPAALASIPRTVFVLAGIHFLLDSYSNVYASLLPMLIPHLRMSLALAGALTMCYQLAASIAQLGFGHLADHWKPRVLIVTGPIVAITMMSLLGLPGSAAVLGLVLVVGGLGSAAFHPAAAAFVHRLARERRGLAMAVHVAAGSAGVAFGPLLAAPIIGRLGLAWTPIFAVPSLVCVIPLLRRVPSLATHTSASGDGFGVLRPYARALSRLYAIIALRTVVWLSFVTFLPVLLTARGESVGLAGMTIAAFLAAAGLGGFFGGAVADHYGARAVIITTLLAAVPFLLVLPRVDGWPLFPVLIAAGFLLQATLPVMVTFGQTLAPVRAATVSSIMMGFALGSGGLLVPLVGLLADHIGIAHTLVAIVAVLPIAASLALALPRTPGPVPGLPAAI